MRFVIEPTEQAAITYYRQGVKNESRQQIFFSDKLARCSH
jgi:hypothetical protein